MVNVCVDPNYFKVEDGQMSLVRTAFGADRVVIFRVPKDDEPNPHVFKKADYPRASKFLVQVQGAGGGSAGARAGADQLVARSGGAGGAYAEALFNYDQVPNEVVIAVGVGGAGGTGNAAGKAGTGSGFGDLLKAQGGPGSEAAMKSGTTRVCHSGTPARDQDENAPGALRIGGGPGGGCVRYSKSQGMSGDGGNSMLGRGGSQYAVDRSDPAEGFGSGAGGALSKDGRQVNGASGRPGLVLVWVFNG